MRDDAELTWIFGKHYPSPDAVWRKPPPAHSGYVLEQHDICLESEHSYSEWYKPRMFLVVIWNQAGTDWHVILFAPSLTAKYGEILLASDDVSLHVHFAYSCLSFKKLNKYYCCCQWRGGNNTVAEKSCLAEPWSCLTFSWIHDFLICLHFIYYFVFLIVHAVILEYLFCIPNSSSSFCFHYFPLKRIFLSCLILRLSGKTVLLYDAKNCNIGFYNKIVTVLFAAALPASSKFATGQADISVCFFCTASKSTVTTSEWVRYKKR